MLVRTFSDEDLAAFVAYQGLAAVRKYQPGAAMTSSEAATFVSEQARQALDARDTWHGRVIELVSERRVIGDLGVWVPSTRDRPLVGDLGIQLNPAFQGLGYAHEALAIFIDVVRHDLGLEALTASCDEANLASATLLERLGMRLLKRAHGARQYGLNF